MVLSDIEGKEADGHDDDSGLGAGGGQRHNHEVSTGPFVTVQ